MNRRLVAALVGILSLGLLITPAAMAPAQAANPGVATIAVTPADTVYKGASILIAVDFPTGIYDEGTYGDYPKLSLFTSDTEDGIYTPVAAGVKSTQDGKRTFSYRVPDKEQWIKAGNEKLKKKVDDTLYNDAKTQLFTPAVHLAPVDPLVVLDPSVDAKTFKASFSGLAAKSGQSTSLQVLTIQTSMTNEVPSPAWKTIKTAKQTSTFTASFTVSDPFELSHTYRVITGTSPVYPSNDITAFAAPGAKTTGLSQVHFDTNEGASVNTRARYFEGQFSMTASSEYPGCTAVTGQLAALKGRGNYSWSFAKKSFTLKLDKKANLCGMGNSKKWALVANHYDKSLLRNTVADYIGSKLSPNLVWTPESRPVDLWMNGAYKGSYILIERIAGDKAAPRLPYDALDDNHFYSKTTNPLDPKDTPGFLLEWDFRKGADKNIQIPGRGWIGIKDPENDYAPDSSASKPKGTPLTTGITPDQVAYIQTELRGCDTKLFGSSFKDETLGWRSCIDKDSAVDYYIAMELMKPVDGNMWASVFMWRDALDGKLHFGPMWDFDLAAGSANRAGGAVNTSGWYLRNVVSTTAKQSSKTWFNRLNEDPYFRNQVSQHWHDGTFQTALTDLVAPGSGFLDAESVKIKASATENFKKWSVSQKLSTVQVVKGGWQNEVNYLRDWLTKRITWMNGNL